MKDLILLMGCSAALLTILVWGISRTASILIIVSCAIVPTTVLHFTSGAANPLHVGIAASIPLLTTYYVVAFSVFLIALIQSFQSTIAAALPLAGWFIWCVIAVERWWLPSPAVVSGLIELGSGYSAYVGCRVLAKRTSIWETVALAFSVVDLIQFIYVVLGKAGITPHAISNVSELVGRSQGTLNQPNALAKVIVFGLPFQLLAMRKSTGRSKEFWVIAIAVGFGGIILTESRTGVAAALLFLWLPAMFRSQRRSTRRTITTAIAGTVAFVVVAGNEIIGRFQVDPTGGARVQLDNIGWHALSISPLRGIGINQFVTIVGRVNRLVASGVPVHNAALLFAVEEGIVGFIGLAVPLILLGIGCWITRNHEGEYGEWSRLLLVTLVVLIFVGVTDWGLLQGSIFTLAMAVIGFMSGERQRVRRLDLVTRDDLEIIAPGRPLRLGR